MTLPLRGYRQTRNYTCGFASALMVLHYFGARPPAHELFHRLGTRRDGTRQSAIVRELRAAGLRANVRYDVDFRRLRREIDRNKLIVAYLFDIEHWLVVYGYAVDPGRVFVADPRPDESCAHDWDGYGERLGGFGIVCSGPQAQRAARQEPLELTAAETSAPRFGFRPLFAQLRCDVSGGPEPTRPQPAQLSLPLPGPDPRQPGYSGSSNPWRSCHSTIDSSG